MARGMKKAKLIPSTATYKRMGMNGGFTCAVYFTTSRWNDKQQMQVRCGGFVQLLFVVKRNLLMDECW